MINRERFNFLRNMRDWYRRVFWHGEVTEGRISLPALHVLSDLRKFCRADQSCVVFGQNGQVDTHATAVLEGRREVWLKIIQTLNISDEQLIQIQTGATNGTNEYTDRGDR